MEKLNPVAALCPMWLENEAKRLIEKADKAENAYTKDDITYWTRKVADAYRQAANILYMEAASMRNRQENN
jgi:hypothetical protein